MELNVKRIGEDSWPRECCGFWFFVLFLFCFVFWSRTTQFGGSQVWLKTWLRMERTSGEVVAILKYLLHLQVVTVAELPMSLAYNFVSVLS